MAEVKKPVPLSADRSAEVLKKLEAPAPVKAAEVPKPTVKKAVEPKVATIRKSAEKKSTTPKKAEAAPKAAASKKSSASKHANVHVIVEHHGRQIGTDTIVKTAEKLWTMAGHEVAKISKIELYVKQEDGAVYCVVNGEAVGKYNL